LNLIEKFFYRKKLYIQVSDVSLNDRFANNTQIINTLQLPQKKSQTVSGFFGSQKSQSVTDLFESTEKSQTLSDQLEISQDGFAMSLSNGDVITNPISLFNILKFRI
jgi:hypothetical protein